MHSIKFTHNYIKMPAQVMVGEHRTFLIGVSIDDISNLPLEFLSWDTAYYQDTIINNEVIQELKHYKLPKGKCLLLTLFTLKSDNSDMDKEIVWTTIRRWTPEKERYYFGLLGSPIEIVYEEEGK